MLGQEKSNAAQAKYWRDRAEATVLAAEKSAAQLLAGQIDAWENAEKSIDKEIQAFYGRYARETGVTIEDTQKQLSSAELKSAKEDIARYYAETERLGLDEEYRTYLRSLSARAYMSRMEELKVNVRHEVEKLAGAQQTAFAAGLGGTYEDAYYRTIFNIQQGTGIGGSFTALNTKRVDAAVAQKWLGDNYSDRIWENKDRLVRSLETIIPRGMALGQHSRVIAKDIATAMNTGKHNAERLARTECNYIANQATYDGYVEAGVQAYQYLATLDNRTSDICAGLDSEIYKLSEAMVGVNYPPTHPNCRSTTIPYFEPDEIDAMFEESQRIARDPETGKTYHVPASMSYEEWRHTYARETLPKVVRAPDTVLAESLEVIRGGRAALLPAGADVTGVRIIAGRGSSTVLRVADGLAERYGGQAWRWEKKRGTIESRYNVDEIHWYELDGAVYETKHKGGKKK